MKVAILAGGVGTRLTEETEIRPKPMVEIGGRPILWHIMKHYAHYDLKDFVVALGYKGDYIKRYMVDYVSLTSDLTVRLKDGSIEKHNGHGEDWTVELVDTGHRHAHRGTSEATRAVPPQRDLHADVGRRRLRRRTSTSCSPSTGRTAAWRRSPRCDRRPGSATSSSRSDRVEEFSEKPQTGEGWINGAFFVLEPGVFDYIDGDHTQWEREPLERLAKDGQLMAYRHYSFWQCMDTLRDKKLLQELWDEGAAPWKVWA